MRHRMIPIRKGMAFGSQGGMEYPLTPKPLPGTCFVGGHRHSPRPGSSFGSIRYSSDGLPPHGGTSRVAGGNEDPGARLRPWRLLP